MDNQNTPMWLVPLTEKTWKELDARPEFVRDAAEVCADMLGVNLRTFAEQLYISPDRFELFDRSGNSSVLTLDEKNKLYEEVHTQCQCAAADSRDAGMYANSALTDGLRRKGHEIDENQFVQSFLAERRYYEEEERKQKPQFGER